MSCSGVSGGLSGGPMTTVISPSKAPLQKSRSSRRPKINSSWVLVISLATQTSRGPRQPAARLKVSRSRSLRSKKTRVAGRAAYGASALRMSPGFRGKKPRKTYGWGGKPLADTAVTSAQGPGTQETITPAARQARTSPKPGSESTGMPASDTRAMVWPSCRAARTWGRRSLSLCS